MTGPRSTTGVSLIQAAALLPPCIVVASTDVGGFARLLAVALLATLGWEFIFAKVRHHAASLNGLTTALVVPVLLPADLAIWQVFLVVSLGVILGELVFGGRGYGFVQPATVAAALLVFSFPQSGLSAPSQVVAIATLPGAVLLLVVGLISWRVIVATFAGLAGYLALVGEVIDPATIATGVAFGLVFLICDPVSATATNVGRWIYGLLAGGLIALFSDGSVPTSQAVVFAALLASIFAPLIDQLVVLAHARRRRRAHV